MRLEDRLRESLSASAATISVPPGDVDAVRGRTGWRPGGMAAAAIAVTVFLIAGVVAFGGLPGAGPPVGGGDEAPIIPTTVSVSTTVASTGATPTTAVGQHPAGFVVASPDGITVLSGLLDVIEHIDIGPVMLAVPDGAGGVVFQVGQSASSISWLPAGAEEAVEIVPADAGWILHLHEVAVIDGSPRVVYTARRSGPELEPEQVFEQLRLYDLVAGSDVDVARVGGYESTATRVSSAAGRFVVSKSAEGYTWFEVVGDDSDFVNPRTEADAVEDFLVWVGQGVLSVDGSTLAYLRGSPRSEAPFDLVIFDVARGAELVSTPIDGAHETTIVRLDWDGTVALVSLVGQRAVIVEGGATQGVLGVDGAASIAR